MLCLTKTSAEQQFHKLGRLSMKVTEFGEDVLAIHGVPRRTHHYKIADTLTGDFSARNVVRWRRACADEDYRLRQFGDPFGFAVGLWPFLSSRSRASDCDAAH